MYGNFADNLVRITTTGDKSEIKVELAWKKFESGNLSGLTFLRCHFTQKYLLSVATLRYDFFEHCHF